MSALQPKVCSFTPPLVSIKKNFAHVLCTVRKTCQRFLNLKLLIRGQKDPRVQLSTSLFSFNFKKLPLFHIESSILKLKIEIMDHFATNEELMVQKYQSNSP